MAVQKLAQSTEQTILSPEPLSSQQSDEAEAVTSICAQSIAGAAAAAATGNVPSEKATAKRRKSLASIGGT
ncbi:hypothetical protein [Pacificimonas flava]|uniref:hypothetical protein n=1 Tax=Pacificimonas flava TaxID=1234595 RepID=UPI0004B75791|nr:hypothetical protein [Pacificimonas flava]MBB5279087.1 hypothetical protein [Pacificimonas flava]